MLFTRIIRLAHLQCRAFCFGRRVCRLSVSRVRSRKLSEIGAKFRRLYGKSMSPSKNITSDFASEVAIYPKSSTFQECSSLFRSVNGAACLRFERIYGTYISGSLWEQSIHRSPGTWDPAIISVWGWTLVDSQNCNILDMWFTKTTFEVLTLYWPRYRRGFLWFSVMPLSFRPTLAYINRCLVQLARPITKMR